MVGNSCVRSCRLEHRPCSTQTQAPKALSYVHVL